MIYTWNGLYECMLKETKLKLIEILTPMLTNIKSEILHGWISGILHGTSLKHEFPKAKDTTMPLSAVNLQSGRRHLVWFCLGMCVCVCA